MCNPKLVYSVFLFFIGFYSSSSMINSNHKCPDEQRNALLVFKQNISSIKRLYLYKADDFCEDVNNPIRLDWKTSTDCCHWIGITCNNITGDVTRVNLACGMLQGVLELDTLLSNLPKLEAVDLSYSGLSVMTENDGHSISPYFYELRLAACNITVFPDFLRAMKNLQVLDLSRNYIPGHIPAWAGEIGANNLIYLDLSDNSITGISEFKSDGIQYLNLQSNQLRGPFSPWICNMKHLKYLDISNNMISELVPQCLRNMSSSLVSLNVKYNMIQGPLPTTICSMKHLKYLDISYNSFHGEIPRCLGNMNSSLVSLNVKSNMFQGPFPATVCNMDNLLYLDMSINSFRGVIPPCFGNIISSLLMIDLGGNKFHGIIPKGYGSCELLERLILHGNKLQGDVPRFLSNCQSLKILDLGNNQLNGTFPRWLGDLQKLQVLRLRSNNLHGSLETSPTSNFLFPSLRIFDISNNGFVGRLPGRYFENFNTLNDMDKGSKSEIVNINGRHHNVQVKSLPLLYPITGYILTVIDLSCNKFEGEIPNVIGNLKSLIVLNLSNNNLNGQIPHVLGNLVTLEALDLSRNQLVGEIPESLVNLNFLSFLNLSQNHLVGRIPEGAQFLTFKGSSFYGNPGLCGLQLTKDCKDLSSPHIKVQRGDWINYMEPVMLGLGCGTLLGVVLGYRMLLTGRPKWLIAISEVGRHTRQKKRKRVHIRKRN